MLRADEPAGWLWGSANGTVLDGKPVQVAELRPGDVLRLGEIAICVRWS